MAAHGTQSAVHLPPHPAGLAMIIQATGDPRVSPRDLARLISREPSFTTEMLRIANSPAYGLGRNVRTVRQATIAMGMRTIRNAALAHAVRAATAKVDTGEFDRSRFWEDSLRRASAALALARHAGYDDPHEAFTIGLIQDIGCMLMAINWPQLGGELQGLMDKPAGHRLQQERRIFGITHTEMIEEYGPSWGFPDDMIAAMVHHHDVQMSIQDRLAGRLCSLARAADALADVGQCKAGGNTLPVAQKMVESLKTRDGATLNVFELSEELNQEMASAAQEMKIKIGKQVVYEDLAAAANNSLLRVNQGYEQLTRKLEQMLDENKKLTAQLQDTNAKLLKMATTDPMTELANRRAYLTHLDDELERAANGMKPMSLLMVDIDHFKKVNDTHGHAAGDEVIKAVARALQRCARDVDMVGRLGGEEFSVVLRDANEAGAEMVAERIRRTIEQMRVDCGEGLVLNVTASIGGTTVPRQIRPTGDHVLGIADAALYDSKQNGRNRVTWRPLSD